MGGKVFHVDDDLHQAVRDWCSQHNLVPKVWVSGVVTKALNARVVDPDAWTLGMPLVEERAAVIKNSTKDKAEIVPKKKLPDSMEKTGDEPWARPPFWQNKNKVETNEES